MHHITLHKREGESYAPRAFKIYNACCGGAIVGSIAQDFGGKWEVVNANFERVSLHTTIKAAMRVAGKVI